MKGDQGNMQSDLFLDKEDSTIQQIHELGDATIMDFPFAFNKRESDKYLTDLLDEIPWQQDTLWIAGREIKVPRLQCWVGDLGSNYGVRGRCKRSTYRPVFKICLSFRKSH